MSEGNGNALKIVRWTGITASGLTVAAIVFAATTLWSVPSDLRVVSLKQDVLEQRVVSELSAIRRRLTETRSNAYSPADAKRDGDIIDLKIKQLEYRMGVMEQEARDRRAADRNRATPPGP